MRLENSLLALWGFHFWQWGFLLVCMGGHWPRAEYWKLVNKWVWLYDATMWDLEYQNPRGTFIHRLKV